MKKIVKTKEFVFAYSYSKRNGLLTMSMYYSYVHEVAFILTVYVRPEEVDHVFNNATVKICISELHNWLKDGHFVRRKLKTNPYFKKSGKPKQKWYKL